MEARRDCSQDSDALLQCVCVCVYVCVCVCVCVCVATATTNSLDNRQIHTQDTWIVRCNTQVNDGETNNQ